MITHNFFERDRGERPTEKKKEKGGKGRKRNQPKRAAEGRRKSKLKKK